MKYLVVLELFESLPGSLHKMLVNLFPEAIKCLLGATHFCYGCCCTWLVGRMTKNTKIVDG